MRYAITIAARSMVPARGGRLLVPMPRAVATLRDARRWVDRMAATWCGALLPTEDGFTAFVVDADGTGALAIECGTDPDAERVDHDRDSLNEMKKGPR